MRTTQEILSYYASHPEEKLRDLIPKIQLEAYRQGMTDAAKLVDDNGRERIMIACDEKVTL